MKHNAGQQKATTKKVYFLLVIVYYHCFHCICVVLQFNLLCSKQLCMENSCKWQNTPSRFRIALHTFMIVLLSILTICYSCIHFTSSLLAIVLSVWWSWIIGKATVPLGLWKIQKWLPRFLLSYLSHIQSRYTFMYIHDTTSTLFNSILYQITTSTISYTNTMWFKWQQLLAYRCCILAVSRSLTRHHHHHRRIPPWIISPLHQLNAWLISNWFVRNYFH